MDIRVGNKCTGKKLNPLDVLFFSSLSLSVCGYLSLAIVGRVSEIKRKQRNISPARSLHVVRIM